MLSTIPSIHTLSVSPVEDDSLCSQFKFWAGTWACLQEDLLSWTFMGAVTNELLKFLFKPPQAPGETDIERREVTVLGEKCFKCGGEDGELPWCPVTHRQA